MDDKGVDLIPDLSEQSQEGHGSTRPNNPQKALRTDRDAGYSASLKLSVAGNIFGLVDEYVEELIVCGPV